REHAQRETANAEKRGVELPELKQLVRLRKAFHRGVLITTLVLAAIAALVVSLPSLVSDSTDPRAEAVRTLVDEERYPEWWATVLIALGLWLIIVGVLLIAYYRGWSTFARRVQLAEFSAATRAQRARALRAELERLESVHRQAEEWMGVGGGSSSERRAVECVGGW